MMFMPRWSWEINCFCASFSTSTGMHPGPALKLSTRRLSTLLTMKTAAVAIATDSTKTQKLAERIDMVPVGHKQANQT